MTDSPPNSPIDLRAFILYHKYQSISTDKSYSNYKKLCETMGKEAISYDEYEKLFNKYLKEDERGLLIPDIRGCILSDVINGKSAEKSIDDLCNAFEACKIDKDDHDFWFKRFENGHLFNRVTFSDFPEDVISEIVEKCDIKSYFNLRNVSHALRTVIDQLAPPCTDFEVNCEYTCINVTVDGVLVADSDYHYPNPSMEAINEQIRGTLSLLLRNPKLRLKYFTLRSYSDLPETWSYKKTVINLLNSLNRKIHVENCSIRVKSTDDLVGILQCFKPRTLDKMSIFGRNGQFDINEIVEMDQWKQAKHLVLVETNLPSTDHLLHFSTVEARDFSISPEDVVKLCKSIPIWTNFEHIRIEIRGALDFETIKRDLNLQPTTFPRIYSISNTNLVIQYERFRYAHSLEITKK